MSIQVIIVGLYAAFGLLAGLAFLLLVANRVDPIARDSSFAFRLVILPGCVGLWPVVVWKWICAGKGASA